MGVSTFMICSTSVEKNTTLVKQYARLTGKIDTATSTVLKVSSGTHLILVCFYQVVWTEA